MREGYQISESELKQIQEIQIELIAEVDRICKKCGIQYNMVGGTMLGAIRHHGHIPWDDDADIGFLRNEYEKFRKACRKELDSDKFYIQDFRDTLGYRWGYGKLRRKDTQFIRLNQENMPYEQGIFIDLMPFDPVPDNEVERRIHFVKCFIYRKIFWSEIGKETELNKFYKILYKIVNRIPEKTIKKSYQKFINKNRKRKTKLVRILTFPTPKKCFGYDKRWYKDLDTYEFGRLSLPGARDYDGYLKVKYCDYMKLPPKDKRKVHPISKLKLIDTNK
ncbi:MAG: LicD family protein [Lachnospiraceae bacterium]|nr:LicD family protein [Lachnospiraceae bacterium]